MAQWGEKSRLVPLLASTDAQGEEGLIAAEQGWEFQGPNRSPLILPAGRGRSTSLLHLRWPLLTPLVWEWGQEGMHGPITARWG